jgi:hypothetical protein
MLKIKWFIAILLTLALPAFATNTYVSPSGSDSNDCLSAGAPCLTLQHAADLATGGAGSYSGGGTIYLANGTYSSGANVTYYKSVNFIGNSGDPTAVVVSTPGAVAFTAQDHAIVSMRDFTISGVNGIALSSRQFAIMDYQNMHFGSMSIHISANEMSKINCGGTVSIAGSAIYHLAVNGQSMIDAGCPTTIYPGVSFYSFAWAVGRSQINAGAATFSGTNSGLKYVNDSSLITGGNNFPGSTSGNVCQNGCLIE